MLSLGAATKDDHEEEGDKKTPLAKKKDKLIDQEESDPGDDDAINDSYPPSEAAMQKIETAKKPMGKIKPTKKSKKKHPAGPLVRQLFPDLLSTAHRFPSLFLWPDSRER